MLTLGEVAAMKMDFGEEWYNLLRDVLQGEEFDNLRIFLSKESSKGNILPSRRDTFKAFRLTSPKDVKVVIMGQDPYHTTGIADGLAFSCGYSKHPQPSLKHILIEIETQIYNNTVDMLQPKYYNLERWAKQGVLLLNTALTVLEGKPSSHTQEWQFFTTEVITRLTARYSGLIFLLWGRRASVYKLFINKSINTVLECGHPMTKAYGKNDTWSNNGHFATVNKLLLGMNNTKINW